MKYKSEKKLRTPENSLRNKTQSTVKSNIHINWSLEGEEKVKDGNTDYVNTSQKKASTSTVVLTQNNSKNRVVKFIMIKGSIQ